MRHPNLYNFTNDEIMEMYGWVYKDGTPKHRYVLLRGTKHEKKILLENIRNFIKPYPKLCESGLLL